LADFLTRHGIAVLRYDDRGTAKSGGSFFGATSEDFAQDALGAVAYLRTRPEIDPARIAIVGHSEGGLLAPMVAVADPALAAIALLAAPGVRGEEILKKQTYDLPRAAGLDDEKAKANAALGMAQLAQRKAADPWLAFFWDYDPAPTLAKVQCPILALNGALDMQVNADVNLPAILAANPKAIIKKLEKLNHLFQTAETGAGLEYGRLEETFAPSAMEILATWLKEQLAPKPKRSIEPPPPAEG
jgi:pimeloyl-ACP methyl ester carboxylesterase